ncbi:uncharacterized protein [Antedon mediterranea]|uniref:uncharacterized protein n=1 Tax=Antedon mediterranea TaxID=105859 RepID=UPI003AF8EB23
MTKALQLRLESAVMSSFITAVKKGNIQDVEQFLTYEGTKELVNQQDGRTFESPLYCACVKGDLVIASCLLANHARVDIKTKWLATPLHAASHAGHEKLVRLLLSHNCKPNEQTHFGDTALHLASTGNHLGVVKALIEAGTDVTLLNSKGRNAIQEAEKEGSDDVISYFNKLFFEGISKNNVVHPTNNGLPPRQTQYRRENIAFYRRNSVPIPSRQSNAWLNGISNGEYQFLGIQEFENDLSVVGESSAFTDSSKKLNIEPNESNRLQYLEETIGTLLQDYKRTKDELKTIQSELDETRSLLKNCRSCHHCARYHGEAEADDSIEHRRYNYPVGLNTQTDYSNRRYVRFEGLP